MAATPYNFGPKFNGQPIKDNSGRDVLYAAIPHNVLDAYRTAVSSNTALIISGGSAQGTFRLSYARNSSQGITPNNDFKGNSFNLRGTQRLLGKIIVDANVSYTKSLSRNAAYVGNENTNLQNRGDGAGILVNFAAGIPRSYDTKYWMKNYISPEGGWNREDKNNFTNTLYNLYENNRTADDDNFRGSIDVQVPVTKVFKFQGFANMNYLGSSYEDRTRGRDKGFNNPEYLTTIGSRFTTLYRGALYYSESFHDFNLMLTGGGEYFRFSARGNGARTDGSIYPEIYRLSNSRDKVVAWEDKPYARDLGSLFYQRARSITGMRLP